MKMTILVTGFEPFGGSDINPAWEAVRRLPETVGEARIVRCRVPVEYGRGAETVLEAAKECRPSVILMIGQAGGRSDITPEKTAFNRADSAAADNAGVIRREEKILPDGPDSLENTAGAEELAAKLAAEGFRVSLSRSAGTFVCNDLYYRVLRATEGTGVRVLFIHVPFLPEQAKEGVPSMELDEIVRTLEQCMEII